MTEMAENKPGPRQAWNAVRLAVRLFFWSVLNWVCETTGARTAAAHAVTAFNPRTPADLYRAGFVVFRYEWSRDGWNGYYVPPEKFDEMRGQVLRVEYEVGGLDPWNGIPFHKVKFSEIGGDEYRAVPKRFADSNLRGPRIFKAAA